MGMNNTDSYKVTVSLRDGRSFVNRWPATDFGENADPIGVLRKIYVGQVPIISDNPVVIKVLVLTPEGKEICFN